MNRLIKVGIICNNDYLAAYFTRKINKVYKKATRKNNFLNRVELLLMNLMICMK